MATLKIDFSDAQGPDLVPEGRYLGRVKQAKLQTSKSSGQPVINLDYQIATDGDYFGRHLFNNVSLAPRALWRSKSVFDAHGIDASEVAELDYDDKTGIIIEPDFSAELVCLVVVHEEYDGQIRSKIKETLPAAAYEEDDVPIGGALL